jgi:multidrug resistance efflux pump
MDLTRFHFISTIVAGLIVSTLHGQQLTRTVAQSPQTIGRYENCPVFAIDAIELPAKETGVIANLPWKEGDELQAKQIVAQIDASDVRMEEGIAASNAALARELANDTTDEDFASSVLTEANVSLKNYEELDRRGAGSATELRAKQLGVEQAELKLQHAKFARKQLLVKADLAQKSLESVRQRLKKFEIIAPFDGQLTKLHKRNGHWVQVGEEIASMVRLNELRVDAYVPLEGRHPSKLVGRNVWITLPGTSDIDAKRLGGIITHFDPEVTSAKTVRIHASVQNFKNDGFWQLLPGMLVSMEILE